MEMEHLGNDGPTPDSGPGAGAAGAAVLLFVCTTTAYIASGMSLLVGAVTFAVLGSLIGLFNAAYDRYVL